MTIAVCLRPAGAKLGRGGLSPAPRRRPWSWSASACSESAGWARLDSGWWRSHQRWACSSFQQSPGTAAASSRDSSPAVLGAVLGMLGQAGQDNAVQLGWDLQLAAL